MDADLGFWHSTNKCLTSLKKRPGIDTRTENRIKTQTGTEKEGG
jgi:hypothetical protein